LDAGFILEVGGGIGIWQAPTRLDAKVVGAFGPEGDKGAFGEIELEEPTGGGTLQSEGAVGNIGQAEDERAGEFGDGERHGATWVGERLDLAVEKISRGEVAVIVAWGEVEGFRRELGNGKARMQTKAEVGGQFRFLILEKEFYLEAGRGEGAVAEFESDPQGVGFGGDGGGIDSIAEGIRFEGRCGELKMADKPVIAAANEVPAVDGLFVPESVEEIAHDRGVVGPALGGWGGVSVSVEKSGPIAGGFSSLEADQLGTLAGNLQPNAGLGVF
jgi:hypothetical protein